MKITYWDAVLNLLNNTEISGPVDGPIAQYTFHKNQTAPTETEIQAKIAELKAAEPMRLLRIERNRRLAETDWIIVKGLEQSVDLTEWKTYRQALRDLPATQEPKLDDQGNLINVDWPEVPE